MARGYVCPNIEKRIDNEPSVVQRHDCQKKEKQKKSGAEKGSRCELF